MGTLYPTGSKCVDSSLNGRMFPPRRAWFYADCMRIYGSHRLAVAFAAIALMALPAAAMQNASNEARAEALYDEARGLQSRGDLKGAAEKYEAMIAIAPKLGVAYNNLGSLYVRLGNYQKAVQVLEKGLKVDPAMTTASALLGIALFEMGDYAAAKPRLEAVVRANPDDNNATMMLVNTLTKLGEFNEAAGHLEHLAAKQPKNPQVWYLLGNVYLQLSESALAKVQEIDPNSVWAHEVASDMAEGMKNYDGAVVEIKKALEIAPRQPGLHYKLGDLYRILQQWDTAYAEFEAEIKNGPNNCRAYWKLGDLLLLQNVRAEEALGHIDEALERCPNFPEARLDRAKLLVKLQRNAEAVPELLASAKATPEEASIHFLLAQAYRALGRADDAKAEMRIFAKLEEQSRAATAQRAEDAIKSKPQ